MRIIDADALLESAGLFEVKSCARGCGKSILHLAKAWLLNEVNNAPTVDAVAVVRCRDCIHYEMGVCLKIYDDGAASSYAWQERESDDFCSYAEPVNPCKTCQLETPNCDVCKKRKEGADNDT